MAIELKANEVVLKNVRLSYFHGFTPYAPAAKQGKTQQDPKYSTGVLIPKDPNGKANIAKLEAAIKAVKSDPKELAKWGGKVPAANFNIFLHDGDKELNDDGEPRNPGHWYLTATAAKMKPGIVNGYNKPITDESEVYSGCWANVHLQLFGYNNESKGISAQLCNIQKTRDDEPLGAMNKKPEAVFEELEPESLLD